VAGSECEAERPGEGQARCAGVVAWWMKGRDSLASENSRSDRHYPSGARLERSESVGPSERRSREQWGYPAERPPASRGLSPLGGSTNS